MRAFMIFTAMLFVVTAYAQKDTVEIIISKYNVAENHFIKTVQYEVGINKNKEPYILFVQLREYRVDKIVHDVSLEGQQFVIWMLKAFIGDNPAITLIKTWQRLM